MGNTTKFYKMPTLKPILMDMGSNGQVIIVDGMAFHPAAPVNTGELEEVAGQDYDLVPYLQNAQDYPVKVVYHPSEFAPLKALAQEKSEDFQ